MQNDTNLLFHLAQIAAILDFNTNPMFHVLSDYITISGITKTLMLHTKIKNLHLFCQNFIILLFHLVQMAAILPWILTFFGVLSRK